MNILVVDAEAEIRLLFFSASDEIGCEVYFAASATEALQILNAEHSIGIAVLAYNAGTFEGIELAKKIRDEFSSRHIPILFLSDTGDTHALVTLLDHGDDVVIKPFSQPVLLAKRGLNISAIAREINRAFRAPMPDYLLCAAALISVIDNGQRMQIWTGGIPPLLVLDARGEIKIALPARHMALGALADAEFDDRSEAVLLNRGDQLVCYTDGITETTSADGEMFGEERLLATLANSDKQGAALIDHLMGALFQHAGGGWLNDDATVFCFDTNAYQGLNDFADRGVENTYAEWDGFEWQTRMVFASAQLKVESPLDMMLNSIPPNPMILAARADLSVIINELFVNALDHGLLKLDSALKEGEDGMLNYYSAREAALATMESGHITFALHCKINKGIAEFALSFEDSGSGFNIDEVLTHSPDESQYSGRGLRMVAAMCDEIISNSSGNTISLRYRWPAQY